MYYQLNDKIVIITKPKMVTYNEVRVLYPLVRVVIQNFADEHTIPTDILELIKEINFIHPLWIHYDIDRELNIQNILFYCIYLSYELIEQLSLGLEQKLTDDEKTHILNKFILWGSCRKCKYFSPASPIQCAVNPSLNLNSFNECIDFKISNKENKID